MENGMTSFPVTKTMASRIRRRNSSVGFMNVLFCMVMLMILPIDCLSTNITSSTVIYQESESNKPPPECWRTIRPAYFLENTVDANRLVLTIPEEVTRKNLKIDVDYEEGHIEVLGWWFKGKIRGEAAKKMCVYGRWALNEQLLSEEAIISSDLVSVYDIFMSIYDKQLIISVPITIESNSLGSAPPPPPSPIRNNGNQDDQITNHASIVIAYGTTLWKKLRGLARLNEHARNYSHYFSANSKMGSLWDVDVAQPPSSLAYEKYRQDALDDFLAYVLGTVDENSNW